MSIVVDSNHPNLARLSDTAYHTNSSPIQCRTNHFILAFPWPGSTDPTSQDAILDVVDVEMICYGFVISMFGQIVETVLDKLPNMSDLTQRGP